MCPLGKVFSIRKIPRALTRQLYRSAVRGIANLCNTSTVAKPCTDERTRHRELPLQRRCDAHRARRVNGRLRDDYPNQLFSWTLYVRI